MDKKSETQWAFNFILKLRTYIFTIIIIIYYIQKCLGILYTMITYYFM